MFARIQFYDFMTISGKPYVVFRVDSLPGASCKDTRSGNGQATWTSASFSIGVAGYAYPAHDYTSWPSGTYSVVTRCSLGSSVTSSPASVVIP